MLERLAEGEHEGCGRFTVDRAFGGTALLITLQDIKDPKNPTYVVRYILDLTTAQFAQRVLDAVANAMKERE